MSVRTIKARHNRITGRVAITFEVDAQTWRNMSRSAREGAHPDTLDYVAAVINTAFIEDDAGAAKGEAHAQDKARAAPDMAAPAKDEFDDIDDGIPF